MKFSKIVALLAGTTLFLAACNQESEQAATAPQQNSNPLLAHVPADTAYVFANLESIPEEVSDAYVARIQPVLDVVSQQVEQFQTDYATGDYEGNEMAVLASALIEELGGSISADNLENIGISLQAHQVLYGMGTFPVVRLELSDAEAFRAAIARIESKVGFVLPVQELNGTTYWRVSNEEFPLGLYIAILDQQLAVSLFPVSAEDRLLTSFLGQKMPDQNMASNNTLAIMNSQKGYSGYGSGIVDISKLANEFLNNDSVSRSYFSPEMQAKFPNMDATCNAEINSVISKAPRMTTGILALTGNEISVRYELELENNLATGLAALVSDVPMAEDSNKLLSASLAVKVGKLRTYLLEKATEIVATPFQCEEFQQLNMNAQQLVQQLNIPMPPMVNNLMGLRVSVDDFDQKAGVTEGRGLMALYVDKPEMFVGMATMLLPGFDELDLANQDEPVKIPSHLLQLEDVDIFATMTDNAIGFSIGEQGVNDLSAFMDADSPNDGTFFSASYDSARQMELKPELLNNWLPVISAENKHQQLHSEFSEALKESYMSMLGQSRFEVRFTETGLEIDSTMTFK